MTINRYRANSLKSAMEKAIAELGPEAKILQVKKIEGFSGDRPEQVEIIAVVDDENKKDKITRYENRQNSLNMLIKDEFDDKKIDNEEKPTKSYKTLAEALRSYNRSADTTTVKKSDDTNSKNPSYVYHSCESKSPLIKDSLIQQKKLIYSENPNITDNTGNIVIEDIDRPRRSIGSRSRISQILHECLTRNQVSGDIAYDILSLLNDEKYESKYEDRSPNVRDYLTDYMQSKIDISGGLDKSGKVVILIGPTGVGKTTTLAKLAAQYHFQKEKNVGLVTIDAYRIAAIDQLRTYAQIMSIPLKVALTPDQLWKCINDYNDMDIVLVDTPGRSHLNRREVKAIEEFLEAAQPADTHLLVSASIKDDDAFAVVDSFAPDYVQKLIFTKLDETASYGLILNVCTKVKKPISYFTIGQNVPDDIKLADIKYLVDLFVTRSRVFK